MTVVLAERKGAPSVRPGRTEFTTALKTSTVIIITMPLSPSTTNTISAPELALMQPDALVINVSRGGIVDEAALVAALSERKIGGASTDVFSEEPAGRENALVKAVEDWKDDAAIAGRLILTPHVAWFAKSSSTKLKTTVAANVEAFSGGEDLNLVA